MNASSAVNHSTTNQPAWFCLRSRPKHEHIAAAHLLNMAEVAVFLPRIRFQRPTRQGLAWVTEALFPNYLFARFNWYTSLRLVQSAPGISGVVHFGDRWPVISEAIIEELQQTVGTTGLHTVSGELLPGDMVEITNGSLRGLRAVVSRAMPSRMRVAVLLEFLGQQTPIDIPANSVIKTTDSRANVFRPRNI